MKKIILVLAAVVLLSTNVEARGMGNNKYHQPQRPAQTTVIVKNDCHHNNHGRCGCKNVRRYSGCNYCNRGYNAAYGSSIFFQNKKIAFGFSNLFW